MVERWAAVEIMGHRTHVGRVSEEPFAGVVLLRVEALQRDGTFEVVRYGGASIFSLRDVTEDQARRAVLPRSYQACDAFKPAAVLPAACEHCGHDVPAHDASAAQRRLPPHGDEDEPPASGDSVPWESMPGIEVPQ